MRTVSILNTQQKIASLDNIGAIDRQIKIEDEPLTV